VIINDNVTATASTVTFAGPVDGAPLLSIAGNAVFNRAVGGNTPLNTLTVSGTTTVAANINTVNLQSYGGAMTIAGDVQLTAQNGGITTAAIDGSSSLQDLTVSAGGGHMINGSIGANAALGSFTEQTAAFIAGGLISATISHFRQPVMVSTSALQIPGNSIFDGVVEGAAALSVGSATFNATVGATTPLASLTASRAVVLSGGSVTTSGDQVYFGSLQLGSRTLLTATSGKVASLQSIGPVVPQTAYAVVVNAPRLSLSGVCQVALNGQNQGTQYTQITNTGALELGCVLEASRGFPYPPGSLLTVASASSLTGFFSQYLEGSIVDIGGELFQVSYLNNQATLKSL
jgi:hypothetical protein